MADYFFFLSIVVVPPPPPPLPLATSAQRTARPSPSLDRVPRSGNSSTRATSQNSSSGSSKVRGLCAAGPGCDMVGVLLFWVGALIMVCCLPVASHTEYPEIDPIILSGTLALSRFQALSPALLRLECSAADERSIVVLTVPVQSAKRTRSPSSRSPRLSPRRSGSRER